MKIIVGLGNPGKKYEKTRHNIGFRILDEFAKENNFPNFRAGKKFNAEISEGIFGEEKIILVKPQTFMNDSGKTVKLLIRDNTVIAKLPRSFDHLWVVHDDIDLPLEKIKIVAGRSAAGHKGVESIIKEIGTKNFVRFRVGIKPVNKEQRTKNNVEKFVLQKFNKEEEKIVKEVIKKTIEAIGMAIKEGTEKAMSRYN